MSEPSLADVVHEAVEAARADEAVSDASETRPVVVRSVVRGSRRYWLIDGLEAHAVWVTRQLPDPSEWVQPGEDCDCP